MLDQYSFDIKDTRPMWPELDTSLLPRGLTHSGWKDINTDTTYNVNT